MESSSHLLWFHIWDIHLKTGLEIVHTVDSVSWQLIGWRTISFCFSHDPKMTNPGIKRHKSNANLMKPLNIANMRLIFLHYITFSGLLQPDFRTGFGTGAVRYRYDYENLVIVKRQVVLVQ